MQKEKIIAGILGVSMVAALGVTGMIIWKAAAHPKQTVKSSVKSVQDTKNVAIAPENTLSVSNNTGLGAGIGGQNQNQSLGSNSGATTETKQKTEDFTQYEKYKDSKSALFGDIKAGTGVVAKAKSKVKIYYVGRFTDGTVFDQSRPEKTGEQPKALEFVLGQGQVIPGMEQGVAGMKAGGTRRVIIPPAVGYGEKGQGSVPPNAVLVFDVQLLSAE